MIVQMGNISSFHEWLIHIAIRCNMIKYKIAVGLHLCWNTYILAIYLYIWLYRVAPQKNGTVDFSGLCSDQQLSFFFTLLDRASFPHYNNTKIIKFGWELFILWVISYGWMLVCVGACAAEAVINRASELWKSGKSRKWQSIRNYS